MRELLAFKAEPAWYAKKNAPDLLGRITRQQERRAFRILAAAEVGAHMQRDGAEGLPPFKLAQMLCVLLSWDDGELTFAQAAYLAGVQYPFTEPKGFRSSFAQHQAWMWELTDEDAARLAMVLLASQEHRGDESPMDEFTPTVLAGLDIPQAGLLATAQSVVHEVIQLGAVEHGKPAEAKPKAAAKKPAKTPAKLPYRYRNPLTGDTWTGRGLQPKWLKVALEGGAKLADFDMHAGGGQ